MDTEGPISVLDRRPRSSSRDKVIADRITRQRSPGPSFRHNRDRRVPSQDSNVGVEDEEGQDVVYRIAQPYRTSFSARHSVAWGKVDRSRSLSPTSSLRSDSSRASAPPIFYSGGGDKRRPRGRSKSPKRVTYNTRVTVRHSDTEDSMFTELSSREYDDEGDLVPMRPIVSPFSRALISPRYNEFSQLSPISLDGPKSPAEPQPPRPRVRDVTNMMHNAPGGGGGGSCSDSPNDVSYDSGLDYSTELKDLSEQITRMQWSPRQNRVILGKPPPFAPPTRHHHPPPRGAHAPHGILKDSQNSRVVCFRENAVPATLGVGQNGSTQNGGTNYSAGQPNGVSHSSWSTGQPNGVSPSSRSTGQPYGVSPSSWSTNSNGSVSRGGSNKGKENDPRSSSPLKAGNSVNLEPSVKPTPSTEFIARDYEHSRQFSYTDALNGHYGEDISQLAKESLMEAERTESSSPVNNKAPSENGGLHINSKLHHSDMLSAPNHKGQGINPLSTSPPIFKIQQSEGSEFSIGEI
ncbi:hypothetical protein Btru_004652 [Bulinus truncatus]|nr:hypothetical protein Btru_004652 [Bulinus truncatus]